MPCGVELNRGSGQSEHVGALAEVLVQTGEVPLPGLKVRLEFVQLHEAESGRQLRGFEVPTHLVKDEQIVVFQIIIAKGGKESTLSPSSRAEQLDLRAAAPAPKQEAAVGHHVVINAHHPPRTSGCDYMAEGKGSHRDVRPGARRSPAQRRAQCVA